MIHIVAIMFMFLTLSYSGTCLCKEIELDKILIDKKLISALDWAEVGNNKKFKTEPVSIKHDEEMRTSQYSYGNYILLDYEFELSTQVDNNKELSSIHLSKFINLPENAKHDYKEDAIKLNSKLSNILGVPTIIKISRLSISKNVHMESETSQWTFNKTRINFNAVKIVDNNISQYSLLNLTYGSINKLKELLPITFFSCRKQLIFSDGDKSNVDNFVIGIDHDSNRIVNAEYFVSSYKLEDKFITLKNVNNDVEVNISINRATGDITGSTSLKTSHASITGKCELMTPKE